MKSVKDYKTFSVNDFALDEYFQTWVFNPDESNDAFWRNWRTNHPEQSSTLDEARAILTNFHLNRYTLPPEQVLRLWKNVQESKGSGSRRKNSRFTILWIASTAAVLAIGISAALMQWRDNNDFEYVTGYGETKSVLLPDSSTVILNANSRISFKNNWDEQPAREVVVNGEAFFSVVHKADDQPFRVTTDNGVSIEVLGTTFNVYHRSVDTKVVLNSGQISLSIPVAKKEKKILMKPGELVECKKNDVKKRVVDPRVYAAWTEKKIILDQTALREMVRMVKDNYGIDIEVASEQMLDQTVSGSMPISDGEGLVKQVASAFQMELVKKDDHYTLKEKI
ncbi:MAG TPA: FecR domain-containing protein [Cyclobacteriaceae bacterium]|nr:FecR domain-containing protein [Cyclobacteriaceae bacterium]